MTDLNLKAQPRSVTGRKVKRLRAQGLIPAILYGPGIAPRAIQVDERELERVLRRAGFTQLINLQIEDGHEPLRETVLVKEVQRHPIRRNLLHVDFYRVVMTEKLRTEVPVRLVGEAPVVARGAILVQNVDTVEVECLPADIPEAIEVDVSRLTETSHAITVADLTAPEGVTILSDPDEVIISITYSRAAMAEAEGEAVEEVETAAPSEPEVIGKGKAAEEEAEEGEEPADE